jgi:hypothetical protein
MYIFNKFLKYFIYSVPPSPPEGIHTLTVVGLVLSNYPESYAGSLANWKLDDNFGRG